MLLEIFIRDHTLDNDFDWQAYNYIVLLDNVFVWTGRVLVCVLLLVGISLGSDDTGRLDFQKAKIKKSILTFKRSGFREI